MRARLWPVVVAGLLGVGPGPAGAQNLVGAGATFPNPVYSKWFDVYHRATGVRVNYQSIGSGAGIRQFIQGTVDFGATDSPMTDAQVEAVGGNVVHLPTVLGAVVLTYNLPALGATPLRLDAATIADIYLGRITRWNHPRIAALNPGVALPREDVIVVHRSDGSGTTYVFVDYLSKVSPEWAERVGKGTSVRWPTGIGGRGNEGVTAQVKQLTGAIGYVELVYALSNRLRVAQVRNRSGLFVTAGLESVSAAAAGAVTSPDTDFRVSITDPPGAGSYPIASFTWLLVRPDNPDPVKARAIRDFLVWILTDEAQRIARELGYAPLPAAVTGLVRSRIGTLRAAGRPLP
jgi:phosphate transport system substrate-binding protein